MKMYQEVTESAGDNRHYVIFDAALPTRKEKKLILEKLNKESLSISTKRLKESLLTK